MMTIGLELKPAAPRDLSRHASPAVVDLRQISVSYGSFQALDQVTIAFRPGATGLVGRNGAGKSTLLRLLLGLIRANKGTGQVLGISLSDAGSRLRRAVGYMPENDAFLPGMKAIEQVALAGELCSLPRREAIRRAHEVLSYTGLGEARYRNVEGFSTGMKQRLKLAVSLVHDPQLLLLDEPTVGLDPPGRARMLDLIADLVHQHQKSLIISTHLIGDIQHTCDDVVMVEQGRVMVAGTMEEILGHQGTRFRIEWEGDGTRFIDLLAMDQIEAELVPRVTGGPVSPFDSQALVKGSKGGSSLSTTRLYQLAREGNVRLRLIDPEWEELGELYHRLLNREMPS
jgi:ABC-2 type transport system ATP-binding protein